MEVLHKSYAPHGNRLDILGDEIWIRGLADNVSKPDLIARQAFETGKILHRVFTHRGRCLYFDGMEDMALLDEQIDFVLLLIPIEPYVMKALARVHEAF